jgi:hypothetical protein
MELKVTKDYSFPEARRLVERSMGPVTYASVAAMSSGPRSTPRQTPRTRVQLDPGRSYSKYAIPSNSPSSDSEDNFQEEVESHKTSSQEDEMESVCSEPIVSHEENSDPVELESKNKIEESTVHPEMEEHGAAAPPPPAAGSSNRGTETSDLADSEQESDKSRSFYVDSQESILVMLNAKPGKKKPIRDFMIKEYLQSTEALLKSYNLNSAALTLNNRASQSSMSWSKDLFVTPNELKRTLGTCKLSNEQSAVIMMLVIHDLYSAANVLLKKWRKGKG